MESANTGRGDTGRADSAFVSSETICLISWFPLKIPSPEKVPKIWTKFGIGGIHSRTKLLVNGMGYFEIETQLLTFRKDILPYEFAYHLILQNRNGNRKVEWGEWGVHPVRICRSRNFFQTRHLHTPKKLLPLHIIEVFAEFSIDFYRKSIGCQ